MKTRRICVLLAITLLAVGSASCAVIDDNGHKTAATDVVLPYTSALTETQFAVETKAATEETPAVFIHERQPYKYDGNKLDLQAAYEKIAAPEVQAKAVEMLSVPVYRENTLLLDTKGFYYLGRDASFYEGNGVRPNYTGTILLALPTTAIRQKEEDNTYCIYETDTGYRLYLFINDYNEKTTPDGYPILVKELLPYEAFGSLKIGDTISDVEAIDPVASIYEKQYFHVWKVSSNAVKNYAEMRYPCATIHYLKDGLLKIEYGTMTDDRKLVITNMEYGEDYTFWGATGRTTDYKISDLDLPGGGEDE